MAKALGKGGTPYSLFFILGVLIVLSAEPGLVLSQTLKEIRIVSSSVSTSNMPTFYARERRFFEHEGFDPEKVVDFSFARKVGKELGF